jgi:DNA-directed RNA polymerase specialized sigma24 family protein
MPINGYMITKKIDNSVLAGRLENISPRKDTENMTRGELYIMLREYCSPETSDAVSEELVRFGPEKQNAFILAYTLGYTQYEAAKMAGISVRSLRYMITDIRRHYTE